MFRRRLHKSSPLAAEFASAASTHDWLRTEVARFMFPDRGIDEAFLGALECITAATEDLAALAGAQFAAGDLVGFELRIESTDPQRPSRTALLRSLPSPIAMMLMCCDWALSGDVVRVRHLVAHGDMVEMSVVWPFSMDVAVSLVSPAASDLAAFTIEKGS
jgi:hypothetical protein